jgi:putative ribosome biogenesis GTPase RsgA
VASAVPAVSAEPTAHATRTVGSGVVGRAGMIAALDASIGALTAEARGGVLVLTGEAGIGKSVLAAELGRTVS